MVDKMKESLFNKAHYLTKSQTEALEKAISFAEQAHVGQKRATGEPYIIHPLSVCGILMDYQADLTTLISALLHDVVEDTNVSILDIKQHFGERVSTIVDGLTKVEKGNLKNEEYSAINFEKLLSASAKDIRVAVVKIADRLHNMRTLAVKRVEKKVPYANETLIFFSPLAERLGLYRIQEELEELGFSYLNPPQYWGIKKLIDNYTALFLETFHECKNTLEIDLEWSKIPLYKSYSFLQEGNFLSELFTITATTDTTLSCYSILGTIHQLYKPIENQFHDYIAIEKYPFSRHLRTKVLINDTEVIFHIQTKTNQNLSKEGIFSFFKRDLSIEEMSALSKNVLRDSITSIKSISTNPIEFYDLISYELLLREISVYTPKMDVVHLPEGSSVIDFAFYLNPSLARNMSHVQVNGQKQSIYTILKDMDIVEIVTGNKELVRLEWLNHVQTSKALKAVNDLLKM